MESVQALLAQLEQNLQVLTDEDLETITERKLVQQVCTQLNIEPASLDAPARDQIRATIQKFIDSRCSEAPTPPSSQQPLAKRQKSTAASGGRSRSSPQPQPGGGGASRDALEAKWSEPQRRREQSAGDDGPGAGASRAPPVKSEGGGGGGGGGGTDLLTRVLEHLSALPADSPGVDAPRIAAALKVPKSDVNKTLYAMERSRRVIKSADQKPLWRINPDAPAGDIAPAAGGSSRTSGGAPRSSSAGGAGAGGGGASSSGFGVELGGKKRLTMSNFRGRDFVDIREWYEKDGEMKPGARGISLPREQWEIVVQNLEAIEEALLGGRGGGSGGGAGGGGAGEDDDV